MLLFENILKEPERAIVKLCSDLIVLSKKSLSSYCKDEWIKDGKIWQRCLFLIFQGKNCSASLENYFLAQSSVEGNRSFSVIDRAAVIFFRTSVKSYTNYHSTKHVGLKSCGKKLLELLSGPKFLVCSAMCPTAIEPKKK